MKKKQRTTAKRATLAKAKLDGLAPLIAEVRNLVQSARRAAASAVNTLQVLTNFEIGRCIVEHQQKGEHRAEYGTELLKQLSARLTDEFGKGFSERNLEYMRRFFLTWKERVENFQSPTETLTIAQIPQQPIAKLPPKDRSANPAPSLLQISQYPIAKLRSLFPLSWTHYLELLAVKDPDERSFYEIEAANEGWSVPELKRQKASALYERLALSRDKKGVKQLAQKGQLVTRPEDILKEPYVLEFLGLKEESRYTESDLEQAIIDRLEHFLLELGKGFLFEARQKRFTFDGDHYFLDLVFYNRLLRAYVLIDLKLDKLTHQDLGQMQMYVNFYDREVKLPEENPTIGLLLCKEKKDAIVKLTLPADANIHAREYKLYLPSKELLQKKLLQWLAEAEARA